MIISKTLRLIQLVLVAYDLAEDRLSDWLTQQYKLAPLYLVQEVRLNKNMCLLKLSLLSA